jgi:hypothetical protein
VPYANTMRQGIITGGRRAASVLEMKANRPAADHGEAPLSRPPIGEKLLPSDLGGGLPPYTQSFRAHWLWSAIVPRCPLFDLGQIRAWAEAKGSTGCRSKRSTASPMHGTPNNGGTPCFATSSLLWRRSFWLAPGRID